MTDDNVNYQLRDRMKVAREVENAPDDYSHLTGTLKCFHAECGAEETGTIVAFPDWMHGPQEPCKCLVCGESSAVFKYEGTYRILSKRQGDGKGD